MHTHEFVTHLCVRIYSWLRYTQFVTHVYECVRDTFICTCMYVCVCHKVCDSFIDSGIHSSWLIYMSMFVTHLYVHAYDIRIFVTHVQCMTHLDVYGRDSFSCTCIHGFVSHKVRDSSICICIICVCVTHVYAVGESFRLICSWLIDMYTYMYMYLTKFVTHLYIYV